MEHGRHHFSEAIESVNNELIKMGTLVEEAIRNSMQALVEHDAELAQKVIDADEKINNMELQIQDQLTILIATEQPVARDLRHIITSLKVVTQIERMGDNAVHISKTAIRLKDEEYIKPLLDLPKMADIGVRMLHEVLTAFAESDGEKAREISKQDDEIDHLNEQIWRELLTYMMEDPSCIQQATSFLFLARWLERFGDHVTNISEWIVYDATGSHSELNM